MDIKVKVGIVGAAGYTGGELIRLLLNHPKVEIVFALSRSKVGNMVSSVHSDLLGETDLVFTSKYSDNCDVLFLCLPHNESKIWIESHHVINDSVKIIDLGCDFRLENESIKGKFVYGLPEVNSNSIRSANYVANPGCFATAIQLALLPLAKAQLLQTVHTTGITGSTGAGQALQATTHFTWRSNNISAYKTLTHQHVAEICLNLEKLTGNKINLEFVPWRGDYTRGIFTSSILQTTLELSSVTKLYEDFYHDNPFVFVSAVPIDLKQVVNTNKCLLHIEKEGANLVVHSAIDNLLKGASGQAVQNMNLMLGFEPTLGLKLKASAF